MGNVTTYGYSDAGGRPENEDHGGIFVTSKNLIAVVADGLGGQGEGGAASALALEVLLQRQENQTHMKTTAVYLCICEGNAVWAHIGDSRLYHFYQNRLCDFTLDHSVSHVEV